MTTDDIVESEPIPLEAQPDFLALQKGLEHAEGFALFFAVCNLPIYRKRVIEALAAGSQRPFVTVSLRDLGDDAFDAVIERAVCEAHADLAVMITDLEVHLPSDADVQTFRTLSQLNWRRNAFVRLGRPLVFWIPDYVLTLLVRHAPDFHDYRSGVFAFAVPATERTTIIERMIAELPEANPFDNMTLVEKGRWRSVLESLLAETTDDSLVAKQQRAKLLGELSILLATLSQFADAERRLLDEITLRRELRDLVGEHAALNNLGIVYRQQGRLTQAEECHKKSLVVYRESGDRLAESRILGNLGVLYRQQGKWARAEKCFKDILVLFRTLGDRHGEGATLNNLGLVFKDQGKWEQAEECYAKSLAIRRELGDRRGEGTTFNNLGGLFQDTGRFFEAEKQYQQSLDIKRELGERRDDGHILNNLGIVYQQQSKWRQAEEYFQGSLAIYREFGDRLDEGHTLNNLGLVYQGQFKWAQAEECYEKSLAILREFGDRRGEGITISNIARLRRDQGNSTAALETAHQALEILKTTEDTVNTQKAEQLVAMLESSAS